MASSVTEWLLLALWIVRTNHGKYASDLNTRTLSLKFTDNLDKRETEYRKGIKGRCIQQMPESEYCNENSNA